jgi:hypothetical protein
LFLWSAVFVAASGLANETVETAAAPAPQVCHARFVKQSQRNIRERIAGWFCCMKFNETGAWIGRFPRGGRPTQLSNEQSANFRRTAAHCHEIELLAGVSQAEGNSHD